MLDYRAPLADLRFILETYLRVCDQPGLPGFDGLSREDVGAFLDGAARICEGVAHPINASGDAEGCTIVADTVATPAGFRDAYRALADGGWIGVAFDPEFGGQGLPGVLAEAFYEILAGANLAFSGYLELTEAAFTAIHAHGDDAQKTLYLRKLASGAWTGAMHLTEPQAGSDLRLLRARAEPAGDGTFRLHGSKTFITNAEHDLSENIVNLVLARLPDAAPGSKGLSLFIVPKYLPRADGTLGERNAVHCVSLEHKMGLRAAPTGVVVYEGAVGYLVGEAGCGLSAMFTMVNDARLGVALQGLGIAEAAYQNAAAYARERRQGRAIMPQDGSSDQPVPIIDHPDVRRMLLSMRAFTEGARALGLWVALQIDLTKKLPAGEAQARAAGLVALLTPVIKGFFTDGGSEVADTALQCFGGYGYIRETGIEQLVRDVRITRIYEGTNGIQALDLVRRKLGLDGGQAFRDFTDLVEKALAEADARPALAGEADRVARSLDDLCKASEWIRQRTAGAPVEAAGGSTDFLRLFGLTAMGWTWLRLLCLADDGLREGKADASFLRAKLATGRFYLHRVLPETTLLRHRVALGAEGLMGLPAEEF